jgi:hypothetical protein
MHTELLISLPATKNSVIYIFSFTVQINKIWLLKDTINTGTVLKKKMHLENRVECIFTVQHLNQAAKYITDDTTYVSSNRQGYFCDGKCQNTILEVLSQKDASWKGVPECFLFGIDITNTCPSLTEF